MEPRPILLLTKKGLGVVDPCAPTTPLLLRRRGIIVGMAAHASRLTCGRAVLAQMLQ